MTTSLYRDWVTLTNDSQTDDKNFHQWSCDLFDSFRPDWCTLGYHWVQRNGWIIILLSVQCPISTLPKLPLTVFQWCCIRHWKVVMGALYRSLFTYTEEAGYLGVYVSTCTKWAAGMGTFMSDAFERSVRARRCLDPADRLANDWLEAGHAASTSHVRQHSSTGLNPGRLV